MNKNENRAVIKYFWLKGYKPIEIFKEMREVLGDEMAPSWTTVKSWVAEFKRGRLSVEDMSRTGRPKDVTTLENISKIELMVEKNRHLKAADIAKAMGISKERAFNILVRELGMRKRENGWERVSELNENDKFNDEKDEDIVECTVEKKDIKEKNNLSTTSEVNDPKSEREIKTENSVDCAPSIKRKRLS